MIVNLKGIHLLANLYDYESALPQYTVCRYMSLLTEPCKRMVVDRHSLSAEVTILRSPLDIFTLAKEQKKAKLTLRPFSVFCGCLLVRVWHRIQFLASLLDAI